MSPLRAIRGLIPDQLINTSYHLPSSILANLYHGTPSRQLQVIGVTGTDGKTTTSTGIYHLLQQSQLPSALISTVAAYIADQQLDTGFHVTTPDAWQLQRLIKTVTQQHISHLVLETTSHGFAQHRLQGIHFDIGVITNITHEHLDYHRTYQNYLHAKAKLLNHVKYAVLNQDDAATPQLLEYLKQHNPYAQVITYSVNQPSSLQAKQIRHTSTGIEYTVSIDNQIFPDQPKTQKITLPLIGEYNVLNSLAVAAVGFIYKLPINTISSALANYPSIPGRMQIIPNKHTNVVVDFAHTPNALSQAQQALKQHFIKSNSSKLIAVFGCAGLRDHQKRPLMGEISATNAQVSILTAEDPRTEDLDTIIDQIAAGCQTAGSQELTADHITSSTKLKSPVYIRVPDRQQAINLALKLAHKSDIVGIFGKGHEQSMCFGTTEHPWSDQQAVQKALKMIK